MTPITPQPGIMEIALYEGGKSAIAGRSDVLKLSSNENPLGPPPSAVAAMAEAAQRAHLYPPTDHADLRQAIAEIYGLEVERLICGVGSDEVLQFICQAFSGPGDEIIYTEHGFSMYPILAHMAGATPIKVAERERVVNVDAILAAITDQTRIVMLTNPGNPTGTILPLSELERLADGLPGHVILVLDCAYIEYAVDHDGGEELARARDNVIMTRTFSKLYGLGGLRIGFGYGPKALIDILTRIRQPFNLSVVQLAAAEAAARDRQWATDCIALNTAQRARLTGGLRQFGIACDDSHANFVLARFADEAEADAAEAQFRASGILVRQVKGYGFPNGLRITVGRSEDVDRVLEAVALFRKAA
ncbi:histidinol-phosphate transaminase [Thalassococcus sp. S3]|uniref:histidinol-phosphate transaminase n=1 Tax=Thalassococcus sp. S3 TaxID=2017482 RepID=UPI00102426FE|nr:histidinol-phosphate transaminase [Thalassococcus sp. S3]QBF30874.1 histidinol-phosphate transaminase [Thalassococcus sp. S3]